MDLVRVWKADREAEREERGVGGANGTEMETEYKVVGYCSNHNTLCMELNSPLAYSPVSEIRHPTMSIIREILYHYIEIIGEFSLPLIFCIISTIIKKY